MNAIELSDLKSEKWLLSWTEPTRFREELTGQWVMASALDATSATRKFSLSFWIRPVLTHGPVNSFVSRKAIMANGSLFFCF